MPDEQGQTETTVVNETPALETPASEGVTTPSESDGQGDLRVPLREERARRQELERSLNDPSFIYEQAKKLGLAEEPEIKTDVTPRRTPAVPYVDRSVVQEEIAKARVQERFPELRKDTELQLKVSALINAGYTWDEAAEKEVLNHRKLQEIQKREAENAKETASTPQGTPPQVGEEAEMAELKKRSRTASTKAEREAAMVELLTRQTIGKVKRGELQL